LLGQVDLAFLSAYAAGMFFAGHLGDRMDLRIFLSIGMLGSGIFCCLFGWVSGPVHSTKQLTNSRRLASETLCSWIAKMYVVDSSVIVVTSITAVVWRSGADAVCSLCRHISGTFTAWHSSGLQW
jgi:sugar phosphate permease